MAETTPLDSVDFISAKNVAAVQRRFLRLVPELYAISSKPLTQKDPRWNIYCGTLAHAYVDTLKARVVSIAGRIRSKKVNKVNCSGCFWWQQPRDPVTGAVERTKKFGRCMEPKQNGEVLGFNPYKLQTKEERDNKLSESEIWTRQGQTCKGAKKKSTLKL